MHLNRNLPYIILALLTAFLTGSQATLSAQKKLGINPARTFQTIESWGAADAWSGNFVGKDWNEKERQQIADWLFSTELDSIGRPKGIGLSYWRVNVGAGTLEQADADIEPFRRRAESFLTVDGLHYDWGKCAGQLYFMREAVKRGCNNFTLFSNSPLVQYTLNHKGWSPIKDGANLRDDAYGLYARYLKDVALHLRKEGFNIRYISPFNEPQVDWWTNRQEGTPWRNSQMARLTEALNAELSREEALDSCQIILAESSQIKEAYTTAPRLKDQFPLDEAPDNQAFTFFDPVSEYYVGHLEHVSHNFTAHTYHNHVLNKTLREDHLALSKELKRLGLGYHMSEWCLLPNYLPPMDGFTSDWKDQPRTDIQVALLLGRIIHSDMVDSDALSWSYWKAMEVNGDHALIALDCKDDNLMNKGTVRDSKILWALGNYSLFIRPGFQRIGLTGADELDAVAASAYLSPNGRRLVVVMVNSSFKDATYDLVLTQKMRRDVRAVNVYLTDEKENLSPSPKVTLNRNGVNLTASARGLTTLVVDMK